MNTDDVEYTFQFTVKDAETRNTVIGLLQGYVDNLGYWPTGKHGAAKDYWMARRSSRPVTEWKSAKQVLSILKKTGRPMHVNEIADCLNGQFAKGSVTGVCSKLHEEGIIQRPYRGIYSLA